MLTGGFSEGALSDLTAPFPRGTKDSNSQYEYEEDSDLEDVGDTDLEEGLGESNTGTSGGLLAANSESVANGGNPVEAKSDVSRSKTSFIHPFSY